jgi:hypothetical protein
MRRSRIPLAAIAETRRTVWPLRPLFAGCDAQPSEIIVLVTAKDIGRQDRLALHGFDLSAHAVQPRRAEPRIKSLGIDAAIQTQSFHTPSCSETDLSAGGFGLSYNARNTTDTRSELGARFSHLDELHNGTLLMLRARRLGT